MVRSKKAKERLYTSRATLNSVSMQLQQQLCMATPLFSFETQSNKNNKKTTTKNQQKTNKKTNKKQTKKPPNKKKNPRKKPDKKNPRKKPTKNPTKKNQHQKKIK
jgi:hypothetical protein